MAPPETNALPPLPAAFLQTVSNTFGPAGRQWLNDLPQIVAAAARRWKLTAVRPFPNLSYNFVARARRTDGVEMVLKLGVPNPELSSEIAALAFYDGRGAARLLDADAEQGMLLLQALDPGNTLLALCLVDDERATRAAAEVMRRLSRPAPENHSLPTVADWARGFARLRDRFEGGTGPFPAGMVAQAEAIFAAYLAAPQTAVLLHGDLHHMNILAHGRSWLAIDPKGLVGESAYETGALLRNPLPRILGWSRPGQIIARRAAILAEILDLDRERVLGWAFAQAVLSIWWRIEDNDPQWAAGLPLAEKMRTLL